MTSFPGGRYTVSVGEEGSPTTDKIIYISSSNKNPTHEIQRLKPCTEYEHKVTLLDNNGTEIFCSGSGGKAKTLNLSKYKNFCKSYSITLLIWRATLRNITDVCQMNKTSQTAPASRVTSATKAAGTSAPRFLHQTKPNCSETGTLVLNWLKTTSAQTLLSVFTVTTPPLTWPDTFLLVCTKIRPSFRIK